MNKNENKRTYFFKSHQGWVVTWNWSNGAYWPTAKGATTLPIQLFFLTISKKSPHTKAAWRRWHDKQ